ncbi:MAG: glycosyltransferase family 4 protein [Candidatus Freyarchaeota archaeon]
MKVALVVPPWISVPPRSYGGIESVVGLLASGLASRGHDVTVYTVGSSRPGVRARWVFEDEMFGYSLADVSRFLNVASTHALWAYFDVEREGFDIVHDNTWKEGLLCASFVQTPVVHTVHGPFDEDNRRFYSLFLHDRRLHFVAISRFQRDSFPGLNYAGVVHNAVDVARYPYVEEKEDYFVYVGRFNMDKAPHVACRVASDLGFRLLLAGKVRERGEKEYFERFIRPYLGGRIKFLGEVGEEEKKRLFARARAFLFPLQWDEPFGITMVEALACGTPVVTFRRGAAPEIVKHGRTGFVVGTLEEFVEAVHLVDEIDPRDCRRRAEWLFSPERLVRDYEEIYRRVVREQETRIWQECYQRLARIGV